MKNENEDIESVRKPTSLQEQPIPLLFVLVNFATKKKKKKKVSTNNFIFSDIRQKRKNKSY